MWEFAGLVLIVLAAIFWIDSLKARERAVLAGREACARYNLQLLDDTVSFTRLRFGRDRQGMLRFARTYSFEFSDTGDNRRHGAILMVGEDLADLQLEPYPMQ
jgi:hypothetical protein